MCGMRRRRSRRASRRGPRSRGPAVRAAGRRDRRRVARRNGRVARAPRRQRHGRDARGRGTVPARPPRTACRGRRAAAATAGSVGRDADLLLDTRGGRPHERRSRRDRRVARDRDPRRPPPPMPSSTIAANAACASGDFSANRAAPAPPYAPPSVETRTSVRCGSGSRPAPAARIPRASSMSAAVPEALSPCGLIRAGVVAMSNDDDGLLGASRDRRRRRCGARRARDPERSSVHTSSSAVEPERARSSPRYQRAASSSPSEPGTRDGNSVVSSVASAAAASPSKSGSSGERGSVPVVETENRKASSAGATTTTKPRVRDAR